ncbi:cytochrome b/b6 domain-containing protein [Marinobacter sp. HL-58]|uniref:cytochrome b n=1 Tax=Marinobacter sp. HL-58 TaxID=1479237 RepID=UPI0004806468|nr:cytochrome b/b6 domain-containing protein [Marinobacter sp. HL-58]KPP99347.1 MAG: cytochrome b561 [Marinobacter sp. HL-58]
MIKDSKTRYGTISKFLHWSMALLVVWQVLKFGDRISDGEHWVGQTLVPWHISIGTLLLVLIVVRLFWAILQRARRPLPNASMAGLVKAGHGLLYLALLLMPVTGILVMLGGGYGVTAFGIEILPKGDELDWAKTLGGLHSPLAWILSVLVAGHVVMALVHHFLKGDDTLKRMV